jgi:hypothetical protein
MSPGCGVVKTGTKTGKTLDGRAPECHARVFIKRARAASRVPAAGRSRDEWFGMQRLSPLLIFTGRRARSQVAHPRQVEAPLASRGQRPSWRRSGRPARASTISLSFNMRGVPSAREITPDHPAPQAATLFSSNERYLLIWIVVKLQFSVKKYFIGLRPPDTPAAAPPGL